MKNANFLFVLLFLFLGVVACTHSPAPILVEATPLKSPTMAVVPSTQTALPQPTATATPIFHVQQTAIEVVTDNAVTGDGGNSWGGHQTRIVHTKDGIFTAYTIGGGGHFEREWQLVERQ